MREGITHADELVLAYTHDDDGSLLSLIRDEPVGASDPALGYEYDSRGRPWRVTQPDGSVVE